MITEVIGKRRVAKALGDLRKDQVPFALALGMTRLAERAKSDVERSLPQNLDRPTPFTQRGLGIKPAKKGRIPSATVFFKDRQSGYLRLQEKGGVRRPAKKALLAPDGARLNKYGNLPRNTTKRLRTKPDVFAAKIGNTEGIWQRRKRKGPKLLIRFIKRARYTERLRFEETVIASARKHAVERIRSAARFARSTAR